MSRIQLVHVGMTIANIAFTWQGIKKKLLFVPPERLVGGPRRIAQAYLAHLPLQEKQGSPNLNYVVALQTGGILVLMAMLKVQVAKAQGVGIEHLLAVEKICFFFVTSLIQLSRIYTRWL